MASASRRMFAAGAASACLVIFGAREAWHRYQALDWSFPIKGGFHAAQNGSWDVLADNGGWIQTRGGFDGRGVLTIGLASEQAHRLGTAYRGVKSRHLTDFTGQAWRVRTDFASAHFQPGMEAKFHVTRDHATDYLSMQLGADGLHLIQEARDVVVEKVVPFDPEADRWWRMRHDLATDTLRFETSADGRAWRERWTQLRRLDLRQVKVEIYAGTYKPVKNPGVVRFSDCCA